MLPPTAEDRTTKSTRRTRRAAALLAVLGVSLAVLPLTGSGGGRAALAGNLSVAQETARQEPKKPDVIYVPTPQGVVVEMLKVAEVKPGNKVYDLGCGDGRIVITAAKDFGATGVGVDIDPARIAESNANAEKAGVSGKVKFLQQDLFEMDFRDADVVALYLLNSLNVRLRPKLLDELKPGARVVSHAFSMGDWKPEKTLQPEGRWVYLWVIPAKVEGTWEGKVAQASGGEKPVVLTLTQKYQELTGTASVDGKSAPIKSGRVNGEQLEVTVTGADLGLEPAGDLTLRAKVSGDTATGTDSALKWSAARKKSAAPAAAAAPPAASR